MANIELFRTRVVNRRHERGDVYIGRGSCLGNPYTHLQVAKTKALYQCATREESIERCEDWVLDQEEVLARIDSLRGKSLECFCDPLACHGVIYVILVAVYDWMRTIALIEPDWTTPEGRLQIRAFYQSYKKNVLAEELCA